MNRQLRQKDIIWIDFDPQKGCEIKKRRPALILSSDSYNQQTGFLIVAPITSTLRALAGYYTLAGYKTVGQVIAAQVYSLDASDKAQRHATYIETMRDTDFYQVAQIVYYNFGFPF